MSKIEEIKARWAAATPGPWSCESDWSNIYSLSDGHLGHFVAAVILRQSKSTKVAEPTSDAAAIAAAPEDIRWLVERVERLEFLAKNLADAVEQEVVEVECCCDPGDPETRCTPCWLKAVLDEYRKQEA